MLIVNLLTVHLDYFQLIKQFITPQNIQHLVYNVHLINHLNQLIVTMFKLNCC